MQMDEDWFSPETRSQTASNPLLLLLRPPPNKVWSRFGLKIASAVFRCTRKWDQNLHQEGGDYLDKQTSFVNSPIGAAVQGEESLVEAEEVAEEVAHLDAAKFADQWLTGAIFHMPAEYLHSSSQLNHNL